MPRGLRRISKATYLKLAEEEKVLFVYLYTASTPDVLLVRRQHVVTEMPFDSRPSHQAKIQEGSRSLLGDPLTVRSRDPQLWSQLGQIASGAQSVLVAVKHGDVAGTFPISAATTATALTEWMTENRSPLADQLDSENFQTVMRTDDGPYIVLAALNPDVTPAEHEAQTAQLLDIARDWHGSGKKVKGRSVTFVWMDGKKWANWLKSMYGVQDVRFLSFAPRDWSASF